MNTHETPQPNTTPTGAPSTADTVRDLVKTARWHGAADHAVECVLAHAPELRAWAIDELTRRGYRAAAARLRNTPVSLTARLAAQNSTQNDNSPVVASADTGAPMLIPLDVELARLMVATGITPAVVLTYWAARAYVSEHARAGGRIRLADLTPVLHRMGLYPAARTLDTWLSRGETAGLWRVHGRGKRRALYIRGHRRLCAHFTARAAKTRPAAVATNLPGKLWAVVEFDGSKLTAAAMLGKLWAAWYAMHPRTHRISHATQRDLWNRSRHQLDEARRAVNAVRRIGYNRHAHGLAPAYSFPKGVRFDNGIEVLIPTTYTANAYAVEPVREYRRATRSNHAAYATAADMLDTHTDTYAPAIDGATGQPGRVPNSRVYYGQGRVSENSRAANRAIARQRTDKARAKVGEFTPSPFAAAVDVYEEFVVTDDGSPCYVKTPPVGSRKVGRRWVSNTLSRKDEDELIARAGGREAVLKSYRAPHGGSVPRHHKGGLCA